MTCKYRALSTMFVILSQLAVPGARAWTMTDYVDPTYVLSHNTTADTSAAQRAIIAAADDAAKQGPWSARSTNVTAPSGDPADYLSWAENYWPDCGYCDSASANTVTVPTASAGPTSSVSGSTEQMFAAETTGVQRRRNHRKRLDDATSTSDTWTAESSATSSPDANSGWSDVNVADDDSPAFQAIKPHNDAKKMSSQRGSTDSASATAASSAFTTAAATTSTSGCTPRPSESAAPGATPTSCAYAAKESRNPDTESLPGPTALDLGPDGILHNALAFALTKSAAYADTASSLTRTLFIDQAINPSGEYSGLIRGPGGQNGTAEGLLDFRGLVKVSNAVAIMRGAGAMDRTVDDGLKGWAEKYITWLKASEHGRNASTAADHLATFYYTQLAAVEMISGDDAGAKETLGQYFGGPYMGQIDAEGAQTHENETSGELLGLQSMITAAKMGSTLDLDFWQTKTSAGSTIKSALDHMLSRAEGANAELASHVAVVKAVYGDPEGIYRAWLEANGGDYQAEPWWFFDQPEALVKRRSTKRAEAAAANITADAAVDLRLGHLAAVHSSSTSESSISSTSPTRQSSLSASWSSVTATSASLSRTGPNSASSPTATVFQTSPGPMPPSPPEDTCSGSASTSCLYSYSASTTATTTPKPSGLFVAEVGLDAHARG